MMTLICIPANDQKKDTIELVIESIFKMIDHTSHECNIFIAHEKKDSFIAETCERMKIDHAICPVMDYGEFNRTLRTTSFSVCGYYDEYFPVVVGALRNACIDEAIERGCEYIFFIDADNVVDVDALDKLMIAKKNDIVGWYYLKNRGAVSCGKYPPKGNEPFKVNVGICGCRLLHRDVFSAVRFNFKPQTIEDVSFSHDVIASGFEIFVHPEVYSDHIGGGYTNEARTYREAQLNK